MDGHAPKLSSRVLQQLWLWRWLMVVLVSMIAQAKGIKFFDLHSSTGVVKNVQFAHARG